LGKDLFSDQLEVVLDLADDCVVEFLDGEALGARLDLLGHLVKVMPVLVYWLLIIETVQNVT